MNTSRIANLNYDRVHCSACITPPCMLTRIYLFYFTPNFCLSFIYITLLSDAACFSRKSMLAQYRSCHWLNLKYRTHITSLVIAIKDHICQLPKTEYLFDIEMILRGLVMPVVVVVLKSKMS